MTADAAAAPLERAGAAWIKPHLQPSPSAGLKQHTWRSTEHSGQLEKWQGRVAHPELREGEHAVAVGIGELKQLVGVVERLGRGDRARVADSPHRVAAAEHTQLVVRQQRPEVVLLGHARLQRLDEGVHRDARRPDARAERQRGLGAVLVNDRDLPRVDARHARVEHLQAEHREVYALSEF